MRKRRITKNPNSKNTTMEELPKEVIQEILSSLPLNSLFQSRYVWPNLIKDPRFPIIHYNKLCQNPKPTSLILYNPRFSNQNLHCIPDLYKCDKAIELKNLPFRLPGDFNILFSCNGFLFLQGCVHFNQHRHSCRCGFFIYNPVTGDWFQLPECPFHFLDARLRWDGFGYDSKSNKYKVIRLLDGADLTAAVFTLGTNSWRKIGAVRKWICGEGVFLNGFLYWVNADWDYHVVGITGFNVGSEIFEEVSIPDSIKNKHIDPDCIYLEVFDGYLTMVDHSVEGIVQVWVMREYGAKNPWVLRYEIPKFDETQGLKPLVVLENGNVLLESGVLLECGGEAFLSYDPKTRKLEDLSVHNLPDYFFAIPHVGTLVALKDVTTV